jgi:hypothetical protein
MHRSLDLHPLAGDNDPLPALCYDMIGVAVAVVGAVVLAITGSSIFLSVCLGLVVVFGSLTTQSLRYMAGLPDPSIRDRIRRGRQRL